jgi:hypothetical protein
MAISDSKSNFIGVCAFIVFAFGVMICIAIPRDKKPDPASCSVSIQADNSNGHVTTKISVEGSQDSCGEVLDQINSYTTGNQEVQGDAPDDDSSASDADAASAPVAASQ